MIIIFLKGLMIGFAIAAPVGPIGLLCITRSLSDGFKTGLMTGLGAALADGVYGAIAAFGLVSLSHILISYQLWTRGIGGLFLIYLGVKFFFKKTDEKSRNINNEKSIIHSFITTFFLTLTNPMTILSFVAVFAGLGIGTIHANFSHATMMVTGVVSGSALWWFVLSFSVTYFLHKRMTNLSLLLINKISGSIIFLFGLFVLSTFF